MMSTTSEVTIYRNAIRQIDPGLESKIDRLLQVTRSGVEAIHDPAHNFEQKRKVSYSSDELMDTSDETVELNNHDAINSFVENAQAVGMVDPPPALVPQEAIVGPSRPTPEEQAENIIKNSELSRAHILEVPGKDDPCLIIQSPVNVSMIDENYQMINAHIENSMRKRILSFEYIDFSKLVVKNRSYRDDEHQHLEIVNRNGVSFLSPVAERETHQINSYARWEQAFRVYSNVITSQLLSKAPEFLQYNHTIHTAAMSYHLENIFCIRR